MLSHSAFQKLVFGMQIKSKLSLCCKLFCSNIQSMCFWRKKGYVSELRHVFFHIACLLLCVLTPSHHYRKFACTIILFCCTRETQSRVHDPSSLSAQTPHSNDHQTFAFVVIDCSPTAFSANACLTIQRSYESSSAFPKTIISAYSSKRSSWQPGLVSNLFINDFLALSSYRGHIWHLLHFSPFLHPLV